MLVDGYSLRWLPSFICEMLHVHEKIYIIR